MKKVLKIVVGFLVFLIVLILLIPTFFKGKIKELVMTEFEKTTEASLYFDNFSLTLIRNFPDFTLSLDQMGIIGKGVFSSDTLLKVKELSATVDLNQVIFGEDLSIKTIAIDGGDVTILVLADGSANYDIIKPSEEIEQETSNASESVSLGLESISISNSEFVYYDQGLSYFMQLAGVNATGEGDFANDIFDLYAKGKVDDVEVTYEGVDYLHNKSIDLDALLSMNLTNSVYTFKENIIHINDFPLAADGSFSFLEDGYGMDLSFSSPGAEFGQLLSLVPTSYAKSFEDIETSGNLKFDGSVKGNYNEENLPAFTFNLNVQDGYVHYPKLPESIKNVQMDLSVTNENGVMKDTRIELQNFHMEMGSNPFDANLILENLKDYRMSAMISSQLNLAEISQYYPMEGYDLRGMVSLNADVSGVYDSINDLIPRIDIGLTLDNGYIKMPEVPAAIEDLTLAAGVVNRSGKLVDTEVMVSDLSLSLDGQQFNANMKIMNPQAPSWEVQSNGSLDLEKLLAIYPIEGMQLKGKIETAFQSKGNMKALEAERFDQLPTSGELKLTDFDYQGEGIEQEISISVAQASFNNNTILLTEYSGKAGSTSYEMDGQIDNFIGFALNDDLLTGKLNVQADQLFVNEWMTQSEEEVVDQSGEPLEVIRIPENIKFDMSAEVDKVIYNSLNLNKMVGNLKVSNGAIRLNNAGFKALNGTVAVNGFYDSKPSKPKFDFEIGAKEISIPASFQSVDIVQKLAPVTEKMTGLFSTDFNIKGVLGTDMMPEYSSLTGEGLIQILQASLGQANLLSGLTGVTKLSNISSATLEKIKMSADIKDGRLFVKPFDVKLGDYETTVSGSTGIDGSIDYLLKMNVPAGKIGAQLNSMLSSLTNSSSLLKGNNLILNVGMGGVFSDPKFTLRSVASADGNTIENAIEAKVEEKKDEVKKEMDAKVNQAKDSASQVVKAKTDTIKAKADSLLKAQKDSLATKAADKLGVGKDSVEKTLEKAKGVLERILKKKKKDNKNNGAGGNI